MAKKKNTVQATSVTSKPTGNRPTSTGATTAPAFGAASKVSHEQVAKRAYEIWVAKGRPVGRDLENWQQAERELGVRK